MKRTTLMLAVVACLWSCALCGTTRADMIVYNTFGEPGDKYIAGSGWGVEGSGSSFGYGNEASVVSGKAE